MEAETGINKCLRQLNNTKFYRPLDNDITDDIQEWVQVKVERMLRDKILDDDTKRFSIQSNSKPGRFYILPKIHNPSRPIVSRKSNPSERILQFVDHHLKMHWTHSFIKGTLLTNWNILGSYPKRFSCHARRVISLH